MNSKLTPELAMALNAAENQRLVVVDPLTNREYVIVEAEKLAMLESLDSVRIGIEQMKNGEGESLADAFSDIRASLKQRN